MLNDYNGSMKVFLRYVSFYQRKKIEQKLYERYTANIIGKLAGAETSYDDILKKLENATSKRKERTANDIKHDLIAKLNNRG